MTISKTILTAINAVVLATSLGATSASAGPNGFQKPMGFKAAKPKPYPHFHGHKKWGKGGYNPGHIGVGHGLGALAVASGAYAYSSDCYITRREMVDEFGDVYLRRVRVCE